MLLLFRGYHSCVKTIYQNKFNSSVNIIKSYFLKRNLVKQHLSFFSGSAKPDVGVDAKYGIENIKRNGRFLPFEKMLENRRLQAKKSILVQVHSENSCAQLHEYCLRFGLITSMIHYSFQSNLHFVIVEFEDANSACDVILKSAHANNTQLVPVRSQFLWFKANDDGKQKNKKNKISENVPFSTFGNVVTPPVGEINSWLLAAKDISDQMTLLFHAMNLDDLGTRTRFITALQIESTLSGLFPLIRVLPFGSTVNSFGKIGCDLDVVVRLDYLPGDFVQDSRLVFQTKTSLVGNRTQQQRYIESIADLIERYLPGCSNVKRILQARVPILKFKNEYTGVECDLSLTNMTGVYMSELLNIYGSIDDRVRPLVFTIRFWAQNVNLTNPSPGRWITNFSLTLLTLFYLQNVKIIPTINELIKLSRPEDKRFAEDVNCTFLRDINSLLDNPVSSCKLSLAELLKGFFDFYTFFDFDTHAISLKTGKTLPKQEHSALYIFNPLESHLNVSKNVSPEELGRLRIEICNAARYLDRELRFNANNSDNEEDWGLVTLLQSSHYNTKGKDLFYSAVQKKTTSLSTNRLVAISDLFEEDENVGVEENVNSKKINVDNNKKINDNVLYHNSKTSTQKR